MAESESEASSSDSDDQEYIPEGTLFWGVVSPRGVLIGGCMSSGLLYLKHTIANTAFSAAY